MSTTGHFTPIRSDPPAGQVRRITLVPFLPDGRCVLVEGQGGPALPSGEVRDGEDYLIDTVLRVPLETAGFRYQRFRPFGINGDHLYGWIEGAPYPGERPHADVELTAASAEDAAVRLREAGRPDLAALVGAAARSYRTLDDQTYYSDSLRTLERAYLRGRTPQEGSGFGGDKRAWRRARHHISEGIGAGTFLDVGCANGLLMESVVTWCAERGVLVDPYGLDLAPGVVELARRRLPQWADRIWAGNAIDWVPPDGLRFDYVHVLLDCVPTHRRGDLIRHHLTSTVRQGGRLLVSDYGADPAPGGRLAAAQTLRALGFACSGQSTGDSRPGWPPAPTAWIDT